MRSERLLGACNQDAEAFVDSLGITSVTPRNGDVGTVLQIEGSLSKGSILAMCGNPLDDQGSRLRPVMGRGPRRVTC